MKNTFIMYAKHIQCKDRKVGELLDKLSNDQREKDCGSYYKSLSGIYRHIGGCAAFFLTLIKGALKDGSTAKAIAAPNAESLQKDVLSEAQWKSVKTFVEDADKALVEFVTALTDTELKAELKWFSGEMVPISYALNALAMHQAHHHGQVSQVLDELKIDNDFSGIPVEFIH
ncbi:hypothetical protein FACS1894102_1620 [Spirochaetia bacterium]|nr:hypothetical protein FACS1894102_1620 [Spirochaetia bacterium]